MKNAKKSMFITTILMVAVLIVAVSTATFAWYTASGEGSANNASLTAAQSADANIGLGWTAAEAKDAEINFTNKAGATFAPMAVYTMSDEDKMVALTDGQTYSYDDVKFASATIDDKNKFNATNLNTNATPWTVSDGASANAFYVRNNNQNAAADIDLGIIFTEGLANNGLLCVAVFVNDKLEGIFTSQNAYAAGEVKAGELIDTVDDKGSAFIMNDSEKIEFRLEKYNTEASGDNAKIQVKAWFDGTDLDQSKAGAEAGFKLTFAGETVTA